MVMDMHAYDEITLNFLASTPIPGHSGWGYLSCSYGILGFIICFLIVRKSFGCLFKSFVVHDKYLLYRISVSIGFLWNFLFSPLAHFKTSPQAIAAVVAFSLIALQEHLREIPNR